MSSENQLMPGIRFTLFNQGWRIHAGAGQAEIARFNVRRHIVPNKPAHPGGGLKVNLESVRQVRRTYVRCRHFAPPST